MKHSEETTILKYKRILKELHDIRERNEGEDSHEEDVLLDRMDAVWYALSKEQQDEINKPPSQSHANGDDWIVDRFELHHEGCLKFMAKSGKVLAEIQLSGVSEFRSFIDTLSVNFRFDNDEIVDLIAWFWNHLLNDPRFTVPVNPQTHRMPDTTLYTYYDFKQFIDNGLKRRKTQESLRFLKNPAVVRALSAGLHDNNLTKCSNK
jgi:hypothetical protein